jgi:hypothetical protein
MKNIFFLIIQKMIKPTLSDKNTGNPNPKNANCQNFAGLIKFARYDNNKHPAIRRLLQINIFLI